MNSFCLYACLDIIVRLFFWLEVVCVFWLFCPCCCWRLFWVFQVVWIFGERAWCAGRGGAAPSLLLLAHFLPGTPRVQPRHMWAHHGTTGTLRAHRGTPGSSVKLDSVIQSYDLDQPKGKCDRSQYASRGFQNISNQPPHALFHDF